MCTITIVCGNILGLSHDMCGERYAVVNYGLPDMEWSINRDDGGVWAGVWWCDDVSPSPDVDSPPYSVLKSSGVLLHFRWWWWCPPTMPFLLLSIPDPPILLRPPPVPPTAPPRPGPLPPPPPPPPPTTDRTSCEDKPNRRLSCDEMPINRLSCIDMNFESWLQCWWLLPCDSAWSSSRPCCSPNRPPTRFGRRSSISFDWLHVDEELPLSPLPAPPPPMFPPDEPPGLLAKFSCLLNIAGNMLNCWPSGPGELRHRFEPVEQTPSLMLPCWMSPLLFMLPVMVVEAPPRPNTPLPFPDAPPPPPPPLAPPPPPKQLALKSNLFPKRCCFWASVKLFSSCDVRSGDRYSLKQVAAAF